MHSVSAITCNNALILSLDELCRILNNKSAAGSTWLKYVPKIISQAQRENGARITSRCSSLIVTEADSKLDGTCFVIYSTCVQ